MRMSLALFTIVSSLIVYIFLPNIVTLNLMNYRWKGINVRKW